ncbi:MAG: hypothetical protein RL748_2446 [Pseudomonadota bacterium]|jgi:outer membrane protein assembly factor BamB
MDDQPEKERSELPEPESVCHEGIRYEAIPWGKARGLPQNGGYVSAFDIETNDELWMLKIYDVAYDGDMEEDKQDIFIDDLRINSEGQLRVSDERGNVYVVDLTTKKVTELT